MLIRFSVENFLSFKDEVEFSMVAGRTQEPQVHEDHILTTEHNDMYLLKTGVIYGANASGKSNLIKAMDFARNLIVKGTRPNRRIPVTPYLLDSATESKASKFQFEIKCNLRSYIYGFEVDSKQVYSEWLYEIQSNIERMMFERKTELDGLTKVDLGEVLFASENDREFLKSNERRTRLNELFLTKTIEDNFAYFKEIYDWFDKKLRIIFPNPRFTSVETAYMTETQFQQGTRELIKLFDLGIDNVKLKESDFPLTSRLKTSILETHREDEQDVTVQFPTENMYFFVSKDNQIRASKFMSVHRVQHEDRVVEFELSQESDGTQRLFELSSVLLGLLSGEQERIYVIDELDRRLHAHMTYNILDVFLTNSANKSSQMIVTTHESNLLDLDLLRRDEIWFIEKDVRGASSVYSLEEFAPRSDMDIRKGYLHGRFGAIPILSSYNVLEWAK